jgi:hypothetical protein
LYQFENALDLKLRLSDRYNLSEGKKMLLAILIGHLLSPTLSHAYDGDVDLIIKSQAASLSQPSISDDKHNNGYESPTGPATVDSVIDDISQDKVNEIKYCTENWKNIFVKHCRVAFEQVQARLARANLTPNDFSKYTRASDLCLRKCGGELPLMPDCQNGMKKETQEEIKKYMVDKKCNVIANNTDAETAVGVKKGQIELGDSSVKTEVSSVNDGDGYRTTATCYKSTISMTEPSACEVREGFSAGAPGETKYVYMDNSGNQFSTRQEAAQSNQSLLFGGGDFGRGGIAEPIAAPIPQTRPQIVTGDSPAGGGKALSGNMQKSGAEASPNNPRASVTNNDPLVNEGPVANTATPTPTPTNVPSNNGTNFNSGATNTSSSFGDPAMFPGLQSAKSSARGTDETTSASGKSLGYANGSSQRGGSRSGAFNSFATGGSAKDSSGNLMTSEVSSSSSRGIRVASAGGTQGGGSTSGSASGMALASGGPVAVAPQKSSVPSNSIHIGEQGFYSPGGTAVGSTGQKINSYGSQKGKNGSKKLKSFGSCPPGNLQCVLATIGSMGSNGKKRSRRSIASQSEPYQLPEGVTSGVEDIFSRVVKFHNNKIHLDHEGMIQNGDGGFSN